MSTNPDKPVWLNRQVWYLSIAETIVWASLFYLFPASLLNWNIHFGWDLSKMSLALTLSLIISSLAGIGSGKLIDLGAGRHLLSFSALLGGIALLVLPTVDSIWSFYAIWAIVGIAMGGCSYDPCFAVLTRAYGNSSKESIVMVTFFAGLSVTLCFIISSIVTYISNWQLNILTFSLLLCLISAPLFWFGSSNYIKSFKPTSLVSNNQSTNYLKPMISRPIFWGLSALFTVFGLNHIMIMSQILPLLEALKFDDNVSIVVAASMGIMQVTGRMLLIGLEKITKKQFPNVLIALICGIALSIASVILKFSESSGLQIVVFLILQGFSFGIINIIKPIIVAEKLGHSNFGVISSIVGFGYIWGFALAPATSGYIFDEFGSNALIACTFATALIGTLIFSSSIYIESKYYRPLTK